MYLKQVFIIICCTRGVAWYSHMRTKSACHIASGSLAVFASSSENANFFSATNSSVDGWYSLRPN